MNEQRKIQRVLTQKKREMMERGDPCIFCLMPVNQPQLVHLIRRSDRVDGVSNFDLQTHDKNIGLGHHECHEIFDDKPWEAVYLRNIFGVLRRIQDISEQHYQRLLFRLEPYFENNKALY